jgi:hypothetical protein
MRRPRYADVTASVALFLALSGGAYALAIPRNSVGARQIRAGAVRASEIAHGAVRADELAPRAVRRESIGFRLGEAAGNGGSETTPVSLKAGQSAVLAEAPLVIRERGLIALASGAVTVTNPVGDGKDGEAATVKLLVLHNGDPEGPAFTQTVGDGMSETIPVSIQCNGLRSGGNEFSLELLATGASGAAGVIAGSRSLDVASFGPIFNPPG